MGKSSILVFIEVTVYSVNMSAKKLKKDKRAGSTEKNHHALTDEQLDKMIDESIEKQTKDNIEEDKKTEKPKEEKKELKKETPKTSREMGVGGYNPWKILMYPHLAEKSINMVELENKLVFIVNKKANKGNIKEAVEKGFDVKVLSVKTEITRKGQKKAYIKLGPDHSAADIATRLGMI